MQAWPWCKVGEEGGAPQNPFEHIGAAEPELEMPDLNRLVQAQQIVEILAAHYVGRGQGHAFHQRDDLILARRSEGHRGCQNVARGGELNCLQALVAKSLFQTRSATVAKMFRLGDDLVGALEIAQGDPLIGAHTKALEGYAPLGLVLMAE